MKERPLRHFLRVYLPLNFLIPGVAILGWLIVCSYAPPVDPTDGPPGMVFLLLPVVLLLHAANTYWLYIWWPFRGDPKSDLIPCYGFGAGGVWAVVCFFGWLFSYLSRDYANVWCSLYVAWLVVALSVALFLWLYRKYLDPSIEAGAKARFDEQRAKLEEARTWAREFVRENHATHATFIYGHYTQADLERDILQTIDAVTHPSEVASIHDHAKQIVTKIDRYRAYEAVRQAHIQESQHDGGVFSWRLIEKEARALLDASCPLSTVRHLEGRLLHRLRQLTVWHRNRHRPAESAEHEAETEGDMETIIAREVRAEAHPNDSEEDIQQEIAYRLRGFQESCAT